MLTVTLAILAFIPQGKGGGGAYMSPARQLAGSVQFDKLDTNKDNSLTAEEFTKGVFGWLDRNSDKFLEKDELKRLPADRSMTEGSGRGSKEKEGAPPEKKEKEKDKNKEKGLAKNNGGDKAGDPASQYLEMMDTNHDSKISPDEFRVPEGWFQELDKNADGKVSKDEYLNKKDKDSEKDKDKEKEKENDKEKAKKDPKATLAKLANMTPDEFIKELDANSDGKITEDEWPMPKGFAMADQNGDGAVDKDEVTQALAYLKNGLKGKGVKPVDSGAGSGEKGKKAKGGDAEGGKKPAPKPEPKPGENPPM